MKKGIYAIKKGKNPLKREIINVFLSKNHENAKLYFQGYLYGEKEVENYVLYQIGEINNNLNIEECKKYISGGYEINRLSQIEKQKIAQTKFEIEKLKNINEKTNTQAENIKELFNGKYIQ